MSNFKMLKLVTGEMLIAIIKEEEDERYVIEYPLTIVPIPSEQANGMQNQVGFAKSLPFSDYSKKMTLSKDSIVIESFLDKKLADVYEKNVIQLRSQESNIIVPGMKVPDKMLKNGVASDFRKLNT